MWPGFHSSTRRHMWVEFVVGSLLCSEGFSPGTPVFLPPQKSTLLNSNSIWKQWMKSHLVEMPLQIRYYYYYYRYHSCRRRRRGLLKLPIVRRDTGHASYVIGLKNIRIHPSTRNRIRCGYIFNPSGERIYFFPDSLSNSSDTCER